MSSLTSLSSEVEHIVRGSSFHRLSQIDRDSETPVSYEAAKKLFEKPIHAVCVRSVRSIISPLSVNRRNDGDPVSPIEEDE